MLSQHLLLLQHPAFQRFMHMIRTNSRRFEAAGRILRLKQYMVSDANCAMIEAVIGALAKNSRVQALYIQNFETVRFRFKIEDDVEAVRRKVLRPVLPMARQKSSPAEVFMH